MTTTPRQFEMKYDDATLMFAERALTAIRAKVYEKQYPAQKMANGEILPIEIMTDCDWADEFEIEEYDVYGIASVIADYSKGGTRVGVSARRVRYPIKTVGAHVGYSLEEINKAQYANKPLKEQRLRALREAWNNYMERGGWFGDTDFGLQGIFTLDLPTIVSPQTFAATTSADDLLALLNSYVSAYSVNTLGIEIPRKMVLGQSQYDKVFSTYRAGTNETVGEAFLRAQRAQGKIDKIVVEPKLRAAVNNQDALVILPDDEDKISLAVAVPWMMLPEQVVNLETIIHSLGRTSLVVCKAPLASLIVTNV